MSLTNAQAVELNEAIQAETDPVFVTFRDVGDTVGMSNWYNVKSTTDAWGDNVNGTTLFEGMVIAKYIALVGGNRDAYNQMLNQGNIGGVDFTRQKMRNALVDIWGIGDSINVLQNVIVKATRGEEVFGGASRTTNTVTALALNRYGDITPSDIVQALGV